MGSLGPVCTSIVVYQRGDCQKASLIVYLVISIMIAVFCLFLVAIVSWIPWYIDMPRVWLRPTRVSCKAQSECEPNKALRV